ncbi:MAG: hypothetical protein JSS61_01170 [Verrucomicrobia bacterium]|nr:hypothetical protein [Verrucomicrobiota bacterium]
MTIYSHNRYQSYDLDFVAYEDFKIVKQALSSLGFHEKKGCFYHKNCDWLIEFVSSPVAVGQEIIKEFENIKVATGTIKMLRPEDSVKDRLASYYHWSDRQGLEQAIAVCQERKIDLAEIESWSNKEGFQEKFQAFLERLHARKRDHS